MDTISKGLNGYKKLLDTDPNGRLTSLRVPRDLSLGGTKPKKFYAPNLNVVRNKSKAKQALVRQERRNGKNNFQRIHNKNPTSRYIQSQGVFSEGAAEIKRPSTHSDRTWAQRDHDTVAAMVIPTIKRNSWKVNKQEESIILNQLLPHDEDTKLSDYKPIVFRNKRDIKKRNVFDNYMSFKKEDNKEDIKPCVKTEIKIEPCFKFENSLFSHNNYDDDNPALMLMKMPHTFPGYGIGNDPNDKNLDYTTGDLLEGFGGKLLIRQSGKIDIVVDNTRYNCDTEPPTRFCEQVVLFPDKASIQDPGVVELGYVTDKIIVSPDWEVLFKQINNKS